jgi:hypothetical protein
MWSFVKRIFAMFTLLAFVYPLVVFLDLVSPWEESRKILNASYSNQSAILMEYSSEDNSNSSYKLRTYLLLPLNETIRIFQKGEEPVEVEIIENITSKLVMINVVLIALFVFIGLPIFRDWFAGKLK